MCCFCLHATEVVEVMMVRHENSTEVSESCRQRNTWTITLRVIETHIERLNQLCHHCGKTFETRNYGTSTLIKLGVGGLLCENVNQ